MAEIASVKKQKSKAVKRVSSSGQYKRRDIDTEEDEDMPAKSKIPPPPIFNSLPKNMEFIHRIIIKCTDPKFMQEKGAGKKSKANINA